MSASLDRVASGLLLGATAELGPGLHVVVGAPIDGTDELALVLAGVQRVRRGWVRVAGADPWVSPGVRSKIASLFAEEPPASAASVLVHARRVLGLRGDAGDARAILAGNGLGAWENVRPELVPASIRRRIAFELAMAHPNPALLVLFEPLSLPDVDRERVLSSLRDFAARGASVVVLTASVRDASDIGGDVILLDRGRFVRRPGVPLSKELAPGRPFVLDIGSSDAKKLAGVLATEPAVEGIEWSREKSSELLRVRGSDADLLALTVARVARAVGSEIISVTAPLPGLDEVRAASVGLWRAAHDAAREAVALQRKAQAEAAAPKPAEETPVTE